MITTTTLTKHTISIKKTDVIERYHSNVFDRLTLDMNPWEEEYACDLAQLVVDLKNMHLNRFTPFFREGCTMMILDNDSMDLLESNVDNKDFVFEIVILDEDVVVEIIPGNVVTW